MIAFEPNPADSTLDYDTETMIRVAAGDRDAFDELVRRNFSTTVRIIAAMMGSGNQAEDLAQEVFLRIYRSRQRYLPTAKFATWLGTITRNVVLNAKRSLARRRDRVIPFVEDFPATNGNPGTSDRVVMAPSYEPDLSLGITRRESALALREAIKQLPERQQQAIELVHLQGMDYASAARKMNTTRPAIKSLLGRGRGALETHLQHLEIESVLS